ncbi:MAG: putative transporter [Bacteroidaceae bacterium]|nr:putative transporter [Bacteroidaceae bacterium]
MDWLSSLFTDTQSVGHIVLLLALVIALGYKMGKIKVGGVSLGSTFVLFTGILAGHIYNFAGLGNGEGYAAPLAVLNFVQDFGLILFVYCIGLQVGPGFFSSLKKDGLKLNAYSVLAIVLNIAMMLGCYFLFFSTDDPKNLPMMVGVLCGAVTNTPGLGAANEALGEAAAHNPALRQAMEGHDIASAYACAYPLAVVGMIGAVILLRYIMRIKLEGELEQVKHEMEENSHAKPHPMTIRMINRALDGITVRKIRDFVGRNFVVSRMERDGEVSTPSIDAVLKHGDLLRIVCAEDDAEAVTAFLGTEEQKDWQLKASPIISKRVVVTKPEVEGKTLAQMHFSSVLGVNVTRLTRSGIDLFADRNLHLQIGDRLLLVGPQESIAHAESAVGNSVKRLNHPNIGPLFLGVLLGVILGSIPFAINGVPMPVKLGLAGGPLIVAILIGAKGYKLRITSYTTTSVNMFVRELGLSLFLAGVGIKAGANFWDTLTQGDGISYVWTGFLITVVPIFVVGIIARIRMKLNYFTLSGLVAGTYTDPPLLGIATQFAGNNAPAVGYSTVYPLSMFLRILSAQLIILFFCA